MNQNNLFLFSWMIGLGSIFLAPQSRVHADVVLPLLNQVPKVISIDEQFSFPQVERFRNVRGLTLELRLTRGNLVSDEWIEFLNGILSKASKRIFVKGTLSPFHIGQIRKIQKVEVHYTVSSQGIDSQALNALFDLGPLHKILLMPDNFTAESLDAIGKLKFFALAFKVPPNFYSNEQINALQRDTSHRKIFSVSADIDPKLIIELTSIKPIALEIRTHHNEVPENLLGVLKDLRGIELTLVVDGRLTQDEAKAFAKIERFSLRADLNDPNEITPGLPQLLDRINPP